MTPLRRTEAAYAVVWPLLLAPFIAAALWASQFTAAFPLKFYVRGDYGPCQYVWREPPYTRGEPNFRFLVVTSDCPIDWSAFEKRDSPIYWGDRAALVMRPR